MNAEFTSTNDTSSFGCQIRGSNKSTKTEKMKVVAASGKLVTNTNILLDRNTKRTRQAGGIKPNPLLDLDGLAVM
jgi:hypothetical protein